MASLQVQTSLVYPTRSATQNTSSPAWTPTYAALQDMIPRRLSRAQSMDVNSSQDNLAGYKAVLLGAAQVPKGIPMMTTSAGTIRPAKVVIMGSGVAGLQAIATAKRLGAVVYASDVRKSAAEQIESVGGRFIEVDGMDDFEDESGYTKSHTRIYSESQRHRLWGCCRCRHHRYNRSYFRSSSTHHRSLFRCC